MSKTRYIWKAKKKKVNEDIFGEKCELYLIWYPILYITITFPMVVDIISLAIAAYLNLIGRWTLNARQDRKRAIESSTVALREKHSKYSKRQHHRLTRWGISNATIKNALPSKTSTYPSISRSIAESIPKKLKMLYLNICYWIQVFTPYHSKAFTYADSVSELPASQHPHPHSPQRSGQVQVP